MNLLRRLSVSHISLRLLALLLAVILWFVATDRPQRSLGLDQRRVTAALALENPGDELEVSEAPESVSVTVEGPRLVLPFQVGDVRASVDLTGLGPGVHSVPVNVELPAGITVKSVEPSEVRVTLELRAHARLPVSVSVDGVPPGLAVRVVSVNPSTVDVYGASSAVRQVTLLSARARFGSGTVRAPVVAQGSDGQPVPGVVLSPVEVEVTLAGADTASLRGGGNVEVE